MAQVVLVIDTDRDERAALAQDLRRVGAKVVEASSGAEGLMEVLEQMPDVVLMAEQVPPLRGDEVVVVLRRFSQVPIVIIGGGGESEELDALDVGADAYLCRPWRPTELVARVRSLFRRYRGLSPENAQSSCRQRAPLLHLTTAGRRLLKEVAARAAAATRQERALPGIAQAA